MAQIKRAQEFLAKCAVRRVISVTNSAMAKLQLARASKEVGYSAPTVPAVQEAHQLLDKS